MKDLGWNDRFYRLLGWLQFLPISMLLIWSQGYTAPYHPKGSLQRLLDHFGERIPSAPGNFADLKVPTADITHFCAYLFSYSSVFHFPSFVIGISERMSLSRVGCDPEKWLLREKCILFSSFLVNAPFFFCRKIKEIALPLATLFCGSFHPLTKFSEVNSPHWSRFYTS